MLADVRFAIRVLFKRPWISLVAIVSLAFGIGANLTAFGIAKTILWQPLAVPEPDRLIAVYNYGSQGTGGYSGLAFPEYDYLRSHNDVLSDFAAYLRVPVFMRTINETERIIAEVVTPNYFSVLAPGTRVGRAFVTDVPEIVLSEELWRRRFGSDPNVIGTKVHLGGSPFTIVGVINSPFRGVLMDWQEPPDIWMPMSTMRQALPSMFKGPTDILTAWNAHALMVVGRLKAGVDVQQAGVAFEVIDKQMSESNPDRLLAWQNKYDFKPRVLPIQRARFFPAYRDGIVNYIDIVAIVMAIVLGIACLNLANLMIAGAIPRQREFAIRSAIGAGRFRLLRQLIIEGLILSLAGGIAGLLVAWWSWRVLALFGRPFQVALPANLPLDIYVYGFGFGLSVLTGILFSIWPARRASRFDIHTSIKQLSQIAGGSGFALRSVMISIQVALSLVLVIGAALLVRTVINARSVDATTDRSHVGLLEIDLFSSGYDDERARVFYDDLMTQVRALPGVDHASLVSMVPLGGRRSATDVTLTSAADGKPQTLQLDDNVVSTDYFATLGIPMLRGRDFSTRDTIGTPPVAIINETMARRFWPDEDAIGKQIYAKSARQNLEIIGVVKDTKGRTVRSSVQPTVFRSATQFVGGGGDMNLQFHTAANPAALLPELRRIVRRLDPDVPITNFRTLQEHVDRALSQERLTATLLTALGSVALGLTLIGLYGVVAFSTSARTREIGIRMAIGARQPDVLKMILSQGLAMVSAGLLIGIVGAFMLTKMLSAMLFGVEPFDALSFSTAVLLIAASSAIAAYIPSWRASRLDPTKALRHD